MTEQEVKKMKLIIEEDNANNDENNENNENDEWVHIFKCISYDGTNEITINSGQIKDAGKTWKGKKSQFEPRLLCKQDTYEKRPEIFKRYGICILSIENGIYLLTKTNIYHMLLYNNISDIIEINKNSNSLLLQMGNSEMSMIDNLRYSGLFESHEYLNETILFGSLLNGRHRCSFNTLLGKTEITVSGSQYETDSCYESATKILLIEGKGGNNESFNIRQLYYPFRSIYDVIQNKKEIIPIYINTDSKKIVHIWKFVFTNTSELTSISCIAYNKYKLI
jgi:hypothetical protein